MKRLHIAILITSHNRKDTTLSCLKALFSQRNTLETQLQVYLVNDGSTDGTGEAIKQYYPHVTILEGSGNLFWNGGMRFAFEEAMKKDYDFYLWLNDDTILFADAIHTLLETAFEVCKQKGRESIVVGTTKAPDSNERTYGGFIRPNKWYPLDFHPVEPSDKPQQCDTMNGNCVLIPREVAHLVGNLSPEFTHAIGDMDYGLRAQNNSVTIWVAPGYIGTCSRNHSFPRWLSPQIPLGERIKVLHSPKGLPPHEWRIFVQRHTGMRWPIYWLKLYLRTIFPFVWAKLGKTTLCKRETENE